MSRFITPFSFHSTSAEVIAGVDLTGMRAIVTGGSAGIGMETARALVTAGAAVTLAVRRPEAGEPAAEELRQSTGNPAVDVKPLDLSDLHSVQAFTTAWKGPLHILVNNAASWRCQSLRKLTRGLSCSSVRIFSATSR
jgi:NAD(P)-dependent dehydrogenase (short-subunit alcohol dehydrogenase family)